MSAQPEDPPVSVKAALRLGDKWVLLRNDRGEWELPGGRIDAVDATLRDTVVRECKEELDVDVVVGDLVDSWLFEVVPGQRRTVVCYAAVVTAGQELTISDEHDAIGLFSTSELDELLLPVGYRNAIRTVAIVADAQATNR